jgi:predicted Asp-tRNA(Asn)/Glu-tRNA(Gln) amidotransferase subunit C
MVLDKKKIKKEAKQILDKFAKALAKVDSEKIEFGVNREDFERKEGEGEVCKDFKEKLLGNAPNHDDDFIIVERGDWK